MSCQRVPRRISVQNDIFRGISSPETEQNSLFCSSCSPGVLEFGTEACFEHILVPQETRFPGKYCFSWTRILAFNASVPKNMKNEFVQARISRSKPLYRDEKIRKKGFCAETRQPGRRPTTKPGNRAGDQPRNQATGQPGNLAGDQPGRRAQTRMQFLMF